MSTNAVAVAHAVAAALGEGWSASMTPSDIEDGKTESTRAYLYGPDEAKVFLWADNHSNGQGRIEAVSVYPDQQRRNERRNKHFSITFAADKDPKRIAGDITRRLLPDYLVELAACQEYIAAVEAARQGREDTADMICKAFKSLNRSDTNNDSIRLSYGGHGSSVTDAWGEVEVSGRGSNVTIELHNVSPKVAADVLSAIGVK